MQTAELLAPTTELMVPAAHAVQAVEPAKVLYVPAGHDVHADDARESDE